MDQIKTHISGMEVDVTKDIFAKNITIDFFAGGKQKIGFVRFSKITDATYLFELNIKGKKVGLSYTIPQEGVDTSEYDDPTRPPYQES
ncbi:hypothetical protein LCGC14_0491190 [marine sediment metagenome]|uniref:Uncharacterized protein n=1 Tax=marine sediment metagenome TaxID=412755 RepID=A0A0F9UTJ0_9ZZZZ